MSNYTNTTYTGQAKEEKTPFGKSYKFSLATLSLIDPKLVTLPVVDHVEPKEGVIDRDYIVGSSKFFRFANFLEAIINLNHQGQILTSGFTKSSGIYNDKSFLGHKSQTFETHQEQGSLINNPPDFNSTINISGQKKPINLSVTLPAQGGKRFVQTVGARTKTNEDIGREIDALPAAELVGLAPIWSTLRLTMLVNGNVSYELLYHSLFPSVWFFAQDDKNSDIYNLKARYSGTFGQMMNWFNGGFGPVTTLNRGSNFGNPWGMINPRPHKRK